MLELVNICFESCDVCHIIPRFRDSQHQRTMSKPERIVEDENIAVGAAILFDNVHARDAKIHAALTYTDNDIAWPLKEDTELRQYWNLRLILARVGLEDRKTGRG